MPIFLAGHFLDKEKNMRRTFLAAGLALAAALFSTQAFAAVANDEVTSAKIG
jgi:hypothetical protein